MVIKNVYQKPAKAIDDRHTQQRGVGAAMAIKTLFAST